MLHGSRSFVLQDDDGQVIETHSISAGLDYPGVGPEHAWLNDSAARATCRLPMRKRWKASRRSAAPKGSFRRSNRVTRSPMACGKRSVRPSSDVVLINLSGRGDKDLKTVAKSLGVTL